MTDEYLDHLCNDPFIFTKQHVSGLENYDNRVVVAQSADRFIFDSQLMQGIAGYVRI